MDCNIHLSQREAREFNKGSLFQYRTPFLPQFLIKNIHNSLSHQAAGGADYLVRHKSDETGS